LHSLQIQLANTVLAMDEARVVVQGTQLIVLVMPTMTLVPCINQKLKSLMQYCHLSFAVSYREFNMKFWLAYLNFVAIVV